MPGQVDRVWSGGGFRDGLGWHGGDHSEAEEGAAQGHPAAWQIVSHVIVKR